MSNRPLTMLQIRRILQLKSNGKSNREIAREIHLSRETVNEYIRRLNPLEKNPQDLLVLTDPELSSLFYKEPSSQATDWRWSDLQSRLPVLYDELQKPHATRTILWEEYRQMVPEGYGHSQFCEHLSRYLETKRAVMHFDHVPAASMMFDFAGDKIALVNEQTGEITWCPVLVCVLPFSGFTYIEALPTARRDYLLNALNNAFNYLGGVPQSAKTDNMAQIVKKSNRYEPTFDELAQQWSLHYGTTLMASRIRKPRDKASAESHVNAVYNRVYAALRNRIFHFIGQMNEALWAELDKFNDRNFQRLDYSRRDRFSLHEKPLLLPLPIEPFIPKHKVEATVQRNCHVTLGEDWHHYSVPNQNIGKKVHIIYDTDHVEIYLNTIRIASHRRDYGRNGYTTLEEHLPPAQKHYLQIKGYSKEYFVEKATAIGSQTANAVGRILEQKIFVEQTYNSCLGVLRLGEKYGNDRLEAACNRAMAGYKVTYMVIKNILERGLDKVSPDQNQNLLTSLPDHENIRGEEDYQ
ncbi:MAG: IS21 family transposase [Bacteroidota bacterium]|nr:IS21 family transposase [Bacteroidota bacterium]